MKLLKLIPLLTLGAFIQSSLAASPPSGGGKTSTACVVETWKNGIVAPSPSPSPRLIKK